MFSYSYVLVTSILLFFCIQDRYVVIKIFLTIPIQMHVLRIAAELCHTRLTLVFDIVTLTYHYLLCLSIEETVQYIFFQSFYKDIYIVK